LKEYNVAIEIITVPDLGGAETVDVIELSVQPGETVEIEDSLLVLESDKATMDVPSPQSGTLLQYLVTEGSTVQVGDAIAEIETVGEQALTTVEVTESAEVGLIQAETETVADNIEKEDSDTLSEQLIIVPDIGSDDDVEVIEVSIAIGDQVAQGDTLMVLESDKATMDVPSSHAGKVIKILVTEGARIRSGAEVAIFEVNAGVVAQPALVAESSNATSETVKETNSVAVDRPQKQQPTPTAEGGQELHDVYAGPAVRLLARELGVSLSKVPGSGPRGRIQKDDINNYVKGALSQPDLATSGSGIPPIPAIDFAQFGEIETVKLSKIQRLTASNMQRNWLNVPHVTHFDDADITELEEFRQSLKREGEKRGIRVTPVAFLIKAIGASLQANPEFNRSLAADGDSYIQKHYINVGMAVDTPRGLVVPVIKDVNEKGIWEISADIAALAGLAREGKLKASDMRGGCFTLSSLGAIGGTGFTPIVNAPESGILGVSKSQMKAVWNGHEFVPRLLLPLCLSYDHRLINGADAGRFMTHLVRLCSDIRYLTL
jgi:pyruvate dehydrogenase E2 component (dihydrolipoamide acetyltransferase)|tara:strand:+ start:2184 stop:3824 length:1641 start_codon:yes stop_codon:yes gene_type:complete